MKRENIKYIKIVFTLIIAVSLFLLPATTLAAKTLGDANTNLGAVVKPSGVPTDSLQVQAGNVIRLALTIVGTLFFLLMIYAGIWWMVARGNEEKITKARGTLIAAIIGLSIIVGSYAVTNFVTNRIILGQPAEGTPTGITDKPDTGPVGPTGGRCQSVCAALSTKSTCDLASQCEYNTTLGCIPDGADIENTFCKNFNQQQCSENAGQCNYDASKSECVDRFPSIDDACLSESNAEDCNSDSDCVWIPT